MFLKALIPAMLLAVPSALTASSPAPTHEIMRAPAGKTVMTWRPVDYKRTGVAKCHPDSTKGYLCEVANAAHRDAKKADATRLSER